eukprot:403375164
MKGQRTPMRFGLMTNKSIKNNITVYISHMQNKTSEFLNFYNGSYPYKIEYTYWCPRCNNKRAQEKKEFNYNEQRRKIICKLQKNIFISDKFEYKTRRGCNQCKYWQTNSIKQIKEEHEIVDRKAQRKRKLKQNCRENTQIEMEIDQEQQQSEDKDTS